MEITEPTEIEVACDPGSPEVRIRVDDHQETASPTEARTIAQKLEKKYPEMMVDEDGNLASIVADLEIAADRAEQNRRQ